MGESGQQYSASQQALGYMYQSSFALYMIFNISEDTSILIEKEDDIELLEEDGSKSLASLKHKSDGDSISNLSLDFWKSVNIWLERYDKKKLKSHYNFYLFTTSQVSKKSFLNDLTTNNNRDNDKILNDINESLIKTSSESIKAVAEKFNKLDTSEKHDFLSRITIIDNTIRINEIPEKIISSQLRTVRREFRIKVYERLEGWWNMQVIKLLTGERTLEISGNEVSDKLANISDEYKADNLPITYSGKEPQEPVDPDTDPRLFVKQLREIKVSSERIVNAIYDYYRAFEQRSSWVRDNVLVEGEVEEYEKKLVEEWKRYRDVIYDEIGDESEAEFIKAGKEIYKWIEFSTEHLRIRERVREPFVVRGSYQILANDKPPKVYWHPTFLKRLDQILTKENDTLE